MKYIAFIVVLLISIPAFSQQISYTDWKKEAETQINLQPEYGNIPKSKEQIEEDRQFIETVLKQDTTHRKGSEHLVKLGFTYLYRGDMETAMRRFNQAWLLDPKNENAYWGYAVVYFAFNDLKEASKQLDKGLLLNPQSSNILTDKATIYMTDYMNSHNVDNLNEAIEVFNQSYKIDPSNQNTLFKLSAAYFYKKDCSNAWKYYNECMKLGGQPVTKEYSEALKAQCKM
jgi:tetratricopeptide (TPR) repeat protein